MYHLSENFCSFMIGSYTTSLLTTEHNSITFLIPLDTLLTPLQYHPLCLYDNFKMKRSRNTTSLQTCYDDKVFVQVLVSNHSCDNDLELKYQFLQALSFQSRSIVHRIIPVTLRLSCLCFEIQIRSLSNSRNKILGTFSLIPSSPTESRQNKL